MVQRTEVQGVHTNKTVKYSYAHTNSEPIEIWEPYQRVPLSANKKQRWEFVDQVVKEQASCPKETKQERVLRNQLAKKSEFKDILQNQKQKHVKRIPTEKEKQETQNNSVQEDEWKIYYRHNHREKEKNPHWKYGDERVETSQIWIDPTNKAKINHLSNGFSSNDHDKNAGSRAKRRQLKNDMTEMSKTYMY